MPVGTLQNALSHPLNPLTCQCHLFTHLQPPSIFLGFGLTGCWKKAVWRRCGQLWIIYIAQPSLLFFFFFLFYFSSVYCGCSTYIFQRPLAVVFGEIVNWIGASALTPWDITILWHAADSFALPVSLLSSGGERRRVCLFALTPPVGFHCAVCLPEYPSLHS